MNTLGKSMLRLLALPAAQFSALALAADSNCNASSLNTTIGSWTVASDDTIYSISAATGRGVCDIARANRMIDATLLSSGKALIIPAEVCDPDNDTCLIPSGNYTADCIKGGLHTYTVVENDSYEYIAQKFEIALDTLDIDTATNETIESGKTIKIPQCSPSRCEVEPYHFTYGTYTDLAKEFNTTVGQIMAFNPTFRFSDDTDAEDGPVISMPINCVNLADNVTVIS